MDNGTRSELLSRLAEAVGSVRTAHPARIAVDGSPAAGKTTLADELAVVLRAQGRGVIRASTDGFHLPRSQRYRRGEYSAEGCYHDSFDYDVLHRVLLDPLGPSGDRRFKQAVSDYRTDTVLSQPVTTAPVDAVLLFDGVFLLRPELIDRWGLRIVALATQGSLVRTQHRPRWACFVTHVVLPETLPVVVPRRSPGRLTSVHISLRLSRLPRRPLRTAR